MIKEKFLTKNQYSRPAKRLNKIRGVVVHYVAVNYQKPEQTVNYFESLKSGREGRYASAHYVIGIDGNGINCIPVDEVAYHCGAKQYRPGITDRLSQYPNYTTIGIEMCHTEKGFTEETLETVSTLVAQIITENKLTINDVYRHYDVTGKNCPKFFVEDGSLWENFKSMVERKCQ